MSRAEPIDLPDRLRMTLGALADALIPASTNMPAASEAGVTGEGLDRVLGVRPDLGEPLIDILEKANGLDSADEVQRLRREEPSAFATLVLVVCSAYYMNGTIRSLIGYPGQIPVLRTDLDTLDSQDPLLQPVVQRGPIYREAHE